MLIEEKNILLEDIQFLIAKYGNGRDSLLPILQAIQKKYGHISDYAMQEVASQLDIHPVEVYGVVTFYSFLSTEPKGKYIIRLCKTISCDLAGKEAIAATIERELGLKFGQTSLDRRYTLEYCNCIGMCDQGPAMLINEKVYTRLTPTKVIEILEKLK
ncbi:MAG: NADH-quinone oxidoreductase subunit NuoE [Candidatus Kapaibacteriales bacterium]